MPTPATPKDPVLQRHTQIVRTIESNLKIKTDTPRERTFRTALLEEAGKQLPAMNQSLVTRLYEAACAIEFPGEEIVKFRLTLQRQIARNLNLTAPAAQPK